MAKRAFQNDGWTLENGALSDFSLVFRPKLIRFKYFNILFYIL